MRSIVYLPLDERPCNADFPSQLAGMTDMALIVPPRAMLGRKKRPSDHEQVREWLLRQASEADYAIVSIDQLVYGGIVPSRLHSLGGDTCLERLEALRQLKRLKPSIRLYAFNLILRAPAYSSSEEEPDYYAQFGSELCERGKLLDKAQTGLSSDERSRLDELTERIPPETVREFDDRRRINAQVNEGAIDLTMEGIIDHLTIPLDDNAEYGFTSMEQRRLKGKVVRMKLSHAVSIYPGADEVGCTLFARAFTDSKRFRPGIRVRYSSSKGPLVIPKFEDRSLNESVKAHLHEAGARLSEGSEAADAVLMVHAPAVDGPLAAEADEPFELRHRSYSSEIHLSSFADAMEAYMADGRTVALADVAVSNGADAALMDLLASRGLLSGLAAYAGWNTSGNALGTVIAHAIVEAYYREAGRAEDSEARRQAGRRSLVYRLLDDWAYQTHIRRELAADVLPAWSASAFDLVRVKERVEERIVESLNAFVRRNLHPQFPDAYTVTDAELPWERMFELSFRIEADSKGAL